MAGRRPVTLAIASAAIIAVALVPQGSAAAAPSSSQTAVYLVQLADQPLATYTGGIGAITATKPTGGSKLNPTAWNYQAYRNYLRGQRDSVLKTAKIDS